MADGVFSTPYGSSYSSTPKKKKKTVKAKTGIGDSLINSWFAPTMPFGGAADIAALLPPSYNIGNQQQQDQGALSGMANIYNMMTGANQPGAALGQAGVAAGGGSPGSIMDPWTGFASQYAGGSADMLFGNPEIVIRDKMKALGFNPDSGMMDLMEEYGPAMQYLSMLGLGTGDPNSYNSGDIINFMADFTDKQLTPGAGGLDAWGMISTILDAPEGSAIAMALQNGSPEEQASTLNNLMMAAVGDMPPVFQRAFAGMLEDKTTDWLSSQAKGKEGYKGFLSDWLQKGGKGILG